MNKRCGYVAVVGKPNVGKSTLINRILGQKLNITSRKPQTTRFNLLGIKTDNDIQAIYVDTPGLHKQQKKAINRLMNRSAESVVHDVDVLIFVVDKMQWNEADEHVLKRLQHVSCPVVLVVNKVDQLENKNELLPWLETLHQQKNFGHVLPISALQGQSVDILEELVAKLLPEGEHFYDEDELTDKSERFLCGEIVREKLMRQLGHELPYATTVEIERFKEQEAIIHIDALILVERDTQKSIVIGKQGQKLKLIGSEARKDIERLLDKKVMLKLWVKVKQGWSDDDRALKSLGFLDH